MDEDGTVAITCFICKTEVDIEECPICGWSYCQEHLAEIDEDRFCCLLCLPRMDALEMKGILAAEARELAQASARLLGQEIPNVIEIIEQHVLQSLSGDKLVELNHKVVQELYRMSLI